MTAPLRFAVRAAADPQTLPRLVNYFAQLGLVPCRVRAETEGGEMVVLIDQPDMPEPQALIVAERMRASFLVEAVALTRGRRSVAARARGVA